MKNILKTRSILAILLPFCLLIAISCSESEDAINPAVDEVGKTDLNANLKKAEVMKEYWVEISPLNNSGVSGDGKLMVDGNILTVEIMAEGLAPDEVHAQHIHGFTTSKKNATCPPPSADMDGDGLVSIGEGLPFYGPPIVFLRPFPMAPNGTIDYNQIFELGMGGIITYEILKPLQNRTIVIHGAYVLTDDDGNSMIVPKGTEGAVYVGSLPVACGQIMPNNNGKKMGMK